MKTLFDQTKLNNLVLKNRFVRSATWERMASSNGHLSNRLINLYEELAKGGVGLIMTSAVTIANDDTCLEGMLGIYDDSFISHFQQLTALVHQYDSRIILQAGFAGKNGKMWAPSDPSLAEVISICKAFGESGRRAMLAGFDGIEIHAAHGYFLSQFLNARKNNRDDEYGGEITNRIRILEEILEAIREQTSPDFNILIKINAIDFFGDEETFYTSKEICRRLASGRIQGIEISGGTGQTIDQGNPPYTESILRDYAAEIAGIVEVPVILVGFNRTPAVMTEILNKTDIEYFAFSRPLIRQPDLINIWQKDSNIPVKCISCNRCFSEAGKECIFN
jgi:2,4-dienoyl-CoA reductase-like NADH-dependent reductase (Old Yellow Enzyme family)